jgi:hypothetical protein
MMGAGNWEPTTAFNECGDQAADAVLLSWGSRYENATSLAEQLILAQSRPLQLAGRRKSDCTMPVHGHPQAALRVTRNRIGEEGAGSDASPGADL